MPQINSSYFNFSKKLLKYAHVMNKYGLCHPLTLSKNVVSNLRVVVSNQGKKVLRRQLCIEKSPVTTRGYTPTLLYQHDRALVYFSNDVQYRATSRKPFLITDLRETTITWQP
ncbi:hypothetical protein AVEN_142667-1 [Araneus ventricosus]|uniref:Uncharacterized protein n=1 Tax=Araneus ventricosus TaxID=182803 RepID=A0A4Y2TGH9_ARAVE|nr:hypothetical protein AVEN_142667-1 [Araneus ventricosus]